MSLAVAALLLLPAAAGAQPATASSSTEEAQGAFAQAAFDAEFRKYTAPRNDFSPFYSWDARLDLDVTLLRVGRHAVDFVTLVESVGTENLGSRISVGGAGYVLGFGYTRTWSDRFTLGAGVQHLSSHLTRDLNEKDREQRALGAPIPTVDDRSEYNVLFVKASRTFGSIPFAPQIAVTFDPINFDLSGARAGYVRPVYVTTRSTLWRGGDRTLALETEHEAGHNPYNNFTLRFEMFRRNQADGRFAMLVAAAPGHNLHVSPNIGGRLDGIAVGFSMRFRS